MVHRLAPLALIALVLLLAGCQRVYLGLLNAGAPPDAVAPAESRVFDPTRGLALDVYRPDGAAGAPVVVFFFGGSWQRGSRQDYRFVGEALAAEGLVAVLPDYRLYPAVRFPAFVEDAARAVAYTRRHATAWGGDPERLILAGHSAGAHVAALLATDPRYLAAEGLSPRALAGLVGIAGPYDFLPIDDPVLIDLFGPPQTHPASQPVTFVDGDEPPTLLLHGEDDRLVWLRNSRRFAAALRAAGVPVTLRRYPALGHVRILTALRFPALAPTRRDLAAFAHAARIGAPR